jgi:hypothetical protein
MQVSPQGVGLVATTEAMPTAVYTFWKGRYCDIQFPRCQLVHNH